VLAVSLCSALVRSFVLARHASARHPQIDVSLHSSRHGNQPVAMVFCVPRYPPDYPVDAHPAAKIRSLPHAPSLRARAEELRCPPLQECM